MKLHDAEDAINAVLKQALDAYTPLSGWAFPEVYWPSVLAGNPTPALQDNDGNHGQYVLFGIRPNTGGIATIGGSPGANKYRRAGVYVAQVNVKADAPRASNACSRLCEAILDGFDLSDGTVWFRNNRPIQGSEHGHRGAWFTRAVTGEFQFDDTK